MDLDVDVDLDMRILCVMFNDGRFGGGGGGTRGRGGMIPTNQDWGRALCWIGSGWVGPVGLDWDRQGIRVEVGGPLFESYYGGMERLLKCTRARVHACVRWK